jgi:hypothetical protein
MRKLALLLVALALLGVVACNDDDGATTTTTMATTTSTTMTTTTTVAPTTTSSTTTTTEPETTTTTEPWVCKTFQVELEDGSTIVAEPGFHSRVELVRDGDPLTMEVVIFASPVGDVYHINDMWGITDLYVLDWVVGLIGGESVIRPLVLGAEDWDNVLVLFQGPVPTGVAIEQGYEFIMRTVPASEVADAVKPCWLYPIQLLTSAEWLENCDDLYWCEAFRAVVEYNNLLVDALEEGTMPPEGFGGGILTIFIPHSYYGS